MYVTCMLTAGAITQSLPETTLSTALGSVHCSDRAHTAWGICTDPEPQFDNYSPNLARAPTLAVSYSLVGARHLAQPAASSAMAGLSFTARFRKREIPVQLTTADPSMGQVSSAIASATGVEESTIKVVIPGKRGQMLRPSVDPSLSAIAAGRVSSCCRSCIRMLTACSFANSATRQPLSLERAGVQSGMRLEVYASTLQEFQQVRNSKDLPGLASFEQELKQTMRRQRGSRNGTLRLPSGKAVHGVMRHIHYIEHRGIRHVHSSNACAVTPDRQHHSISMLCFSMFSSSKILM